MVNTRPEYCEQGGRLWVILSQNRSDLRGYVSKLTAFSGKTDKAQEMIRSLKEYIEDAKSVFTRHTVECRQCYALMLAKELRREEMKSADKTD